MKKFFYLFLAFMVFVSGFSVLLSNTVNASSEYDNSIQVKQPPYQLTGYNYVNGQTFASTFEIGQYLGGLTPETIISQAQSFCSITNVLEAIDFMKAGAPYLIGYIETDYYNYGIGREIQIYVDTSGLGVNNITYDWYSGGYVYFSSQSQSLVSFRISTKSNGSSLLCSNSDSKMYSGSIYSSYLKIIETNVPVTYPTGYDGIEIPVAEPKKQIVKPNFSWNQNDKNLQIKHEKNADTLPTGADYQLGITLGYCPNGYSDYGALCEDYQALRYEVIDKGGVFNYDVSEYGDYLIGMEYTWQECVRYPSYPVTPDYCYFSPPQDTDEYDFEDTEVRLNIGKTQTSSGSTSGLVCDVSGFCQAPSPYTDCSTFGLDVGGYFQCVISNFGTWLVITIKSLFIPNFGVFKSALDNFTGSFQSQLGFLYSAFEMLVTWLGSLLTINADCTVDMGTATFFGSPIDINFCAFEQSVPNIFNPLVLIARSILAAGFVFIFYRRMIEIIRGLGS